MTYNLQDSFHLVYDFRNSEFVDVRELSLEELRDLLDQYQLYDSYKRRIVEEMNVKSSQGNKND